MILSFQIVSLSEVEQLKGTTLQTLLQVLSDEHKNAILASSTRRASQAIDDQPDLTIPLLDLCESLKAKNTTPLLDFYCKRILTDDQTLSQFSRLDRAKIIRKMLEQSRSPGLTTPEEVVDRFLEQIAEKSTNLLEVS